MEMKTLAFPRLEPTLDGGALVSAVVVQDEMDIKVRGHFLLQLIEKLDELLATMPPQTAADDLAIEDVEGGKQRRRSVSFIVMRSDVLAIPV
jgi:hypothetical protein